MSAFTELNFDDIIKQLSLTLDLDFLNALGDNIILLTSLLFMLPKKNKKKKEKIFCARINYFDM